MDIVPDVATTPLTFGVQMSTFDRNPFLVPEHSRKTLPMLRRAVVLGFLWFDAMKFLTYGANGGAGFIEHR